MIGYIAILFDGESYRQASAPSVVHTTTDAAYAEAQEERRGLFDSTDYWEVELPEPTIPVPAPDGWAVVAEDDGQLGLVPA